MKGSSNDSSEARLIELRVTEIVRKENLPYQVALFDKKNRRSFAKLKGRAEWNGVNR